MKPPHVDSCTAYARSEWPFQGGSQLTCFEMAYSVVRNSTFDKMIVMLPLRICHRGDARTSDMSDEPASGGRPYKANFTALEFFHFVYW